MCIQCLGDFSPLPQPPWVTFYLWMQVLTEIYLELKEAPSILASNISP
jgi:hypothetical protein